MGNLCGKKQQTRRTRLQDHTHSLIASSPQVQAPHMIENGVNKDSEADAKWSPCIRGCDKKGQNFDCPGVESAKEQGLSLCPDVSGTQPETFAEGSSELVEMTVMYTY